MEYNAKIARGVSGRFYLVFDSSIEADDFEDSLCLKYPRHCFGQYDNAFLLSDILDGRSREKLPIKI